MMKQLTSISFGQVIKTVIRLNTRNAYQIGPLTPPDTDPFPK